MLRPLTQLCALDPVRLTPEDIQSAGTILSEQDTVPVALQCLFGHIPDDLVVIDDQDQTTAAEIDGFRLLRNWLRFPQRFLQLPER